VGIGKDHALQEDMNPVRGSIFVVIKESRRLSLIYLSRMCLNANVNN